MPKLRKFDIPSRKEIIALLTALHAIVTDRRLRIRIENLILALKGSKMRRGISKKRGKRRGNPLAKKAMKLAREKGISLKEAWKRVR